MQQPGTSFPFSTLVRLAGATRRWAAGLALALATVGAAQAQTFAPVVPYTVGAYPQAVATADINADGRPDLLVANTNASNVGVLLGTGTSTGTFGAMASYNAGTNGFLTDLAVGDVNGDGRPDVLTANSFSGTVGVLLGNASGTLQPVVTYNMGTNSRPGSLVLGDVNNDGRLDVLTAGTIVSGNQQLGSIAVLLGNGNGTFQPVFNYLTFVNGAIVYPSDLVVSDVNADGKLDVLAANSSYGVLVMLGAGTSTNTFSTPTAYYSYGSGRLAVGDVNGDGRPDVCTVSTGSFGTVGVLLNNGSGGFTLSASAPSAGNSPYGLTLGDANGDGRLDVLTANLGSGEAAVLLGTGTGAFQAATTYTVGTSTSYPYGIAAADVNGDGRLDLFTANSGTNAAGVLLNTTAPTLTSLSPTVGQVGTVVTLTGAGFSGATGVSFNGRPATFTVVNAGTITATVAAGTTTGNVVVTTPNGPAGGQTFTVTSPDLVISTAGQTIAPGTYNSITVNSGGTGTLVGNVTVNASVTINSGGTLNDGCAVIGGAASFTLAAGGTLGICSAAGISGSGATGAVQTTGTRTFAPDASYAYNGTAAQSTGPALPAQVRNLTTTNANTVTLSQATSVAQVLTVGDAGNLVLNGNALTLLSSAAGTALVVNSSTGIVSGSTAVVQRYIDGSLNSGPGYRHYSVPVTGTTLADFTTSSFTPVLNASYNSSATPASVTPFPTLFVYNQSVLATANNNLSNFDKGWLSPGSLTNGTTPGIGYCVNISAGEVVDFVGTLYNNPVQIGMNRTTGATAADGGWALIGNPFPAPLDLSLVQAADRSNLDAATYVIQSTGRYTGGYRAYVNGVSTSASNSPLLAMGQGFFARVSAGQTNGSFTFRNAQRVTTYATQAAFQRTTTDPRPQVRLELAGAGLADSWVAYVETGATPNFDSQLDAGKLPNSTGLNLSSVSPLGENLAIDGYPAFTASTALLLAVGVPAAGTYTLAATALNNLPAGLDAYLRDSQTGQTMLLTTGTSYSFSVTAAQATALLTGRFTLLFRSQTALATVAALAATDVTVYPNPAHASFTVALPGVAGASTVQAELLNTLGQVVRRQAAALPTAGTTLTLPTADLAAGVYVLRLQAGATTLAKRVVIQ